MADWRLPALCLFCAGDRVQRRRLAISRQTCRRFASALSVVDSSGINATDLFARAVTVGRVAARRPGYLSARLARNLRE